MPSLESIAPDARFITFPVTDGDSARRPGNMTPPPANAPEVNWHREMTMVEKYSCRWRNLVGQGIARQLDKPENEKYCLESFPGGYWMFDHNKGPASNVRHDLYLYGSKTVGRFRSPAEFIPHGYWLLTDPTLNKQNCGCKYCGGGEKRTQKEISEALGLPTSRGPRAVTGSTRMRTGGIRPSGLISKTSGAIVMTDGWIPRENRKERKIDPVQKTTSLNLNLAANIARIADLRSDRMFRIGELIWCLWDSVAGCAPQETEIDRSLRFWPAIVLDYSFEAPVEYKPPLSALSHSVAHRRHYTVLRLGAPSLAAYAEYECMREENQILPWHAYHVVPPSSNAGSIRSDGSLHPFIVALRAGHNLLRFWAVCDRLPIRLPKSLMQSVPTETGDGVSRSVPSVATDHPRGPVDSHVISSRSTPPSSLPYHLDATPPQRSPARLVPPSTRPRISRDVPTTKMSASSSAGSFAVPVPSQRLHGSRVPQQSGTMIETRYEGIWYGAERIWTGDVVRLCPEHEAFATSLRLSLKTLNAKSWQQQITPSPGATMRGVLMRIERIFARISEAGTKECVVAGMLYEVAPMNWTDATGLPTSKPPLSLSRSSSEPASLSQEPSHPWAMTHTPPPCGAKRKRESNHEVVIDVPSFPLPPAPPGYTLRPLLPPQSEIPLPVSFIAGRYYPKVPQQSLLAPVFPKIPKEMTSLSQLASMDACELRLLSLCALVPGKFNCSTCVDVRLANRAAMLEEAVQLAHAELKVIERPSMGVKRKAGRISPEVSPVKKAHRELLKASECGEMAQVSGLLEAVREEVMEGSVAWRKVEDRIREVEAWERGMRKWIRDLEN